MLYTTNLLTHPDEAKKIYAFIKQFPLDYPDYEVWLKKCLRELELGYKKAFYTKNDRGNIVASIIFQQHKQEPQILEIKNIRVNPIFSRQGIGSTLEVMCLGFAKEQGFKFIQVDAHPNHPVIYFLQKRGYIIAGHEPLYSKNTEIILSKEINHGSSGNSR